MLISPHDIAPQLPRLVIPPPPNWPTAGNVGERQGAWLGQCHPLPLARVLGHDSPPLCIGQSKPSMDFYLQNTVYLPHIVIALVIYENSHCTFEGLKQFYSLIEHLNIKGNTHIYS